MTFNGLSVRKVRRVRAAACVVFIITSVVVFGLGPREIGVGAGNGWFAAIGNGALLAGYETIETPPNSPVPPPTGQRGVYLRRRYQSDWVLAWRPFRAKPTNIDEFMVLPLWPLTLGSLVVASWAHGWLRATRYSAVVRCGRCDYPLEPTTAGGRAPSRCPECGLHASRDHASLPAINQSRAGGISAADAPGASPAS